VHHIPLILFLVVVTNFNMDCDQNVTKYIWNSNLYFCIFIGSR
jgi:hypothetical protein